MSKKIKEWIRALVIALAIVLILSILAGVKTVGTQSMVPTINVGDMVIYSKIANVERGDIVSFSSPITVSKDDINKLGVFQKIFIHEGDKMQLIKRVIAIPGDELSISNGVVKVNGQVLDEPYVSSKTLGEIYYQSIPEGKYFCMGDNRSKSLDSRNSKIGLVDSSQIIGEVILRVWPFSFID